MNIIVIDLETTGLDPQRHGIVEIGAINAQSGEEFHSNVRLWEDGHIDQEALAVNGLTADECRSEANPAEPDAMREFLAWLPKSAFANSEAPLVIAGMNPRFDRDFVDAAAQRCQCARPWSHRTLDLHSLALAYAIKRGRAVPDSGFSSDAIYRLLKMEPEQKPHRAIAGARIEFAAFQKLFTELL